MFINGERYSGVIIGSYVGIKQGQYVIVGQIEKESAIDSLNDIEGTIKSLLVILGAEFEDGDDTTLQNIKKNVAGMIFQKIGNESRNWIKKCL